VSFGIAKSMHNSMLGANIDDKRVKACLDAIELKSRELKWMLSEGAGSRRMECVTMVEAILDRVNNLRTELKAY
jgi:hypothetical protein